METHLRPLTLGEILDRTALLYRTHFLLFAGIASVYAGVLLVLSLHADRRAGSLAGATHDQPACVGHRDQHPCDVARDRRGRRGLAVAANNRAVSWVHLGEPATIRAAYRSILPRLGRYLWLMVITTFIVWIPFAVLYAGYTVFIFLYARPKGIFAQSTDAARPAGPYHLRSGDPGPRPPSSRCDGVCRPDGACATLSRCRPASSRTLRRGKPFAAAST